MLITSPRHALLSAADVSNFTLSGATEEKTQLKEFTCKSIDY